jgi:uncharacterized membrane protein YgcG
LGQLIIGDDPEEFVTFVARDGWNLLKNVLVSVLAVVDEHFYLFQDRSDEQQLLDSDCPVLDSISEFVLWLMRELCVVGTNLDLRVHQECCNTSSGGIGGTGAGGEGPLKLHVQPLVDLLSLGIDLAHGGLGAGGMRHHASSSASISGKSATSDVERRIPFVSDDDTAQCNLPHRFSNIGGSRFAVQWLHRILDTTLVLFAESDRLAQWWKNAAVARKNRPAFSPELPFAARHSQDFGGVNVTEDFHPMAMDSDSEYLDVSLRSSYVHILRSHGSGSRSDVNAVPMIDEDDADESTDIAHAAPYGVLLLLKEQFRYANGITKLLESLSVSFVNADLVCRVLEAVCVDFEKNKQCVGEIFGYIEFAQHLLELPSLNLDEHLFHFIFELGMCGRVLPPVGCEWEVVPERDAGGQDDDDDLLRHVDWEQGAETALGSCGGSACDPLVPVNSKEGTATKILCSPSFKDDTAAIMTPSQLFADPMTCSRTPVTSLGNDRSTKRTLSEIPNDMRMQRTMSWSSSLSGSIDPGSMSDLHLEGQSQHHTHTSSMEGFSTEVLAAAAAAFSSVTRGPNVDVSEMTGSSHELLGLESLQPHQGSVYSRHPQPNSSLDYAGAAASTTGAGSAGNLTPPGTYENRKHSLSESSSSRGFPQPPPHAPQSSSGMRLSFSDSNAGEEDCGLSLNSWAAHEYDSNRNEDDFLHLGGYEGPGSLLPLDLELTNNHAWKRKNAVCPPFRTPESSIMSVIMLQPCRVSVQRTTVLKLLDFVKQSPSNCRCLWDIDAPWFLIRMMSRFDTRMQQLYMELIGTLFSYDMNKQNAKLLLDLATLHRQLEHRNKTSGPLKNLQNTGGVPPDLKDLETLVLLSIVELVKKDVPNDRVSFDGFDSSMRFGPVERFPSAKAGYSVAFWISAQPAKSSELIIWTWDFHAKQGLPSLQLYLKKVYQSSPTTSSHALPHNHHHKWFLCLRCAMSLTGSFGDSPGSNEADGAHKSAAAAAAAASSSSSTAHDDVHLIDVLKLEWKFEADVWRHIVITHSKQTLRLHLDGATVLSINAEQIDFPMKDTAPYGHLGFYAANLMVPDATGGQSQTPDRDTVSDDGNHDRDSVRSTAIDSTYIAHCLEREELFTTPDWHQAGGFYGEVAGFFMCEGAMAPEFANLLFKHRAVNVENFFAQKSHLPGANLLDPKKCFNLDSALRMATPQTRRQLSPGFSALNNNPRSPGTRSGRSTPGERGGGARSPSFEDVDELQDARSDSSFRRPISPSPGAGVPLSSRSNRSASYGGQRSISSSVSDSPVVLTSKEASQLPEASLSPEPGSKEVTVVTRERQASSFADVLYQSIISRSSALMIKGLSITGKVESHSTHTTKDIIGVLGGVDLIVPIIMVEGPHQLLGLNILAGSIKNSAPNLGSLATLDMLRVLSFLIGSQQISLDSDVASVLCEILESIVVSFECMTCSPENALDVLVKDVSLMLFEIILSSDVMESSSTTVVTILHKMNDVRTTIAGEVDIVYILSAYDGCFEKLRSPAPKSTTHFFAALSDPAAIASATDTECYDATPSTVAAPAAARGGGSSSTAGTDVTNTRQNARELSLCLCMESISRDSFDSDGLLTLLGFVLHDDIGVSDDTCRPGLLAKMVEHLRGELVVSVASQKEKPVQVNNTASDLYRVESAAANEAPTPFAESNNLMTCMMSAELAVITGSCFIGWIFGAQLLLSPSCAPFGLMFLTECMLASKKSKSNLHKAWQQFVQKGFGFKLVATRLFPVQKQVSNAPSSPAAVPPSTPVAVGVIDAIFHMVFGEQTHFAFVHGLATTAALKSKSKFNVEEGGSGSPRNATTSSGGGTTGSSSGGGSHDRMELLRDAREQLHSWRQKRTMFKILHPEALELLFLAVAWTQDKALLSLAFDHLLFTMFGALTDDTEAEAVLSSSSNGMEGVQRGASMGREGHSRSGSTPVLPLYGVNVHTTDNLETILATSRHWLSWLHTLFVACHDAPSFRCNILTDVDSVKHFLFSTFFYMMITWKAIPKCLDVYEVDGSDQFHCSTAAVLVNVWVEFPQLLPRIVSKERSFRNLSIFLDHIQLRSQLDPSLVAEILSFLNILLISAHSSKAAKEQQRLLEIRDTLVTYFVRCDGLALEQRIEILRRLQMEELKRCKKKSDLKRRSSMFQDPGSIVSALKIFLDADSDRIRIEIIHILRDALSGHGDSQKILMRYLEDFEILSKLFAACQLSNLSFESMAVAAMNSRAGSWLSVLPWRSALQCFPGMAEISDFSDEPDDVVLEDGELLQSSLAMPPVTASVDKDKVLPGADAVMVKSEIPPSSKSAGSSTAAVPVAAEVETGSPGKDKDKDDAKSSDSVNVSGTDDGVVDRAGASSSAFSGQTMTIPLFVRWFANELDQRTKKAEAVKTRVMKGTFTLEKEIERVAEKVAQRKLRSTRLYKERLAKNHQVRSFGWTVATDTKRVCDPLCCQPLPGRWLSSDGQL